MLLAGFFRDAGGHQPSLGSSLLRVPWLLGKNIYVCGKTTGKLVAGFEKNQGELELAQGHGQVTVVPLKLVDESQDTQAGDLSPRGFVQAELALGEYLWVCL